MASLCAFRFGDAAKPLPPTIERRRLNARRNRGNDNVLRLFFSRFSLCLKRGDFGLSAGLQIPPGPRTWSAPIDNRGEHWVWGLQGPDGPSAPFVVPEGEWVGALKAPDRQVELLEEKAKFRVTPPTELPADHGLSYLDERPRTVDWWRASSNNPTVTEDLLGAVSEQVLIRAGSVSDVPNDCVIVVPPEQSNQHFTKDRL